MQDGEIVSFIDPLLRHKGLFTAGLVVFLIFLAWLTLRQLATYCVTRKIQRAHKDGRVKDERPEVTQWLRSRSIAFFWLHLTVLVIMSYCSFCLYSVLQA